jgi:hypothetical protein
MVVLASGRTPRELKPPCPEALNPATPSQPRRGSHFGDSRCDLYPLFVGHATQEPHIRTESREAALVARLNSPHPRPAPRDR